MNRGKAVTSRSAAASKKTSVTNGRNGYSTAADEQLMIQFREEGDVRAFNALVRRYEKPLYNYLVGYLRNRQLAEEAFQATFLRVHEKAHLFSDDRKVRPWIFSIATHEAIDELRREGRFQAVSLDAQQQSPDDGRASLADLVAGSEPTPYEESSGQERAAWTRRAVAQLPEYMRAVVLLVFFQDLKYREVAEILNIPVGTVKSRLHNAVCEMARKWQREHPQDTADFKTPNGLANRACRKAARKKRSR
jgi:RNA polymerase sigma-70 factor (ECF subfamily)